jgi:hypothetical protein
MTEQPNTVFPFTDEHVAEVAEVLGGMLDPDDAPYLADAFARSALVALARVMHVEYRRDPMGVPRGHGWTAVRGVTNWYTLDPQGNPVVPDRST